MHWRRALRPLVLSLGLVGPSGCVTEVPAGATLETPAPAAQRLERHAWLAPVSMPAPMGGTRQSLENAFTINLRRFLEQGGYFSSVDVLPGRVGADDLVLRLELTRHRVIRAQRPSSLLGVFGAPDFTDTLQIAGRLSIQDAAGHVLGVAERSLESGHDVSRYSVDRVFPKGAEARTRFVREILETALDDMRGGEGG